MNKNIRKPGNYSTTTHPCPPLRSEERKGTGGPKYLELNRVPITVAQNTIEAIIYEITQLVMS